MFLLILVGCKKNAPNSILEGQWNDISNETILGGLRYTLNFKGNTFFVKKFTYSDVFISNCNQTPFQYDYYAGYFDINQDSLFLKGTIVKSTNLDSAKTEQMLPDCNNSYGMEYNHIYRFKMYNDTLSLFPRDEYYLGNTEFDKNDSITKKFVEKLTIYLKRN